MVCKKCSAPLPDGAIFCPMCGRKQITERKRKRRTTGSGNISKLSGKRQRPYLARKNGLTIGTFATVREAEAALARLTDYDISEKYNWTFRQIYDQWYPEHQAVLEARAAATGTGTTGMSSYAGAYKHCSDLHDRQFRSIRKGELQQILNRMDDEGLSRSSCEKVKQLFGQLYGWAVSEHIVPANLADQLVIRPGAKKDPAVFTSQEIKAIQNSPHKAAPIALILLATGVRIGELFSLKTEDCFDDYFVGGSKTRAGVGRTVPVSPIGVQSYHSLLKIARQQGLPRLVDAYSGNKTTANYRKRDYYPMLDSLGISRDKTPHKTRHAYATAAVSNGVPPELLTAILGHASYTTTINIYTHQKQSQILSAARQVTFDD